MSPVSAGDVKNEPATPRRRGGRPFKPGNPGRPVGAVNKATLEIKAASRALLEDPAYQASLRIRLQRGTAPHMETLLHHYAYGKPKDEVDVNARVTGEIDIIERIRRGRARIAGKSGT